jgi:tetratricopeptide (TPR) repeat protein
LSCTSPPQAVEHFKIALRLDPRLPLAHTGLGFAYAEQKQYDRAAAEFRKELSRDADFPAALFGLGAVLAAQNHLLDARAYLERATVVEPAGPTALMNFGPVRARAHFELGRVHLKLRAFDKAITALQTALKLNPDDPYCHYHLGYCFTQKKRYREAADAFREFVKRKPEDAGGQALLAMSLFADGQLRAAGGPLECAMKLLPRAGPEYAKCVQLGNCLTVLRKLEDDPFADVAAELKRLPDGRKLLQFARDCWRGLRYFASAARLYAEAFKSQPLLADEFEFGEFGKSAPQARFSALTCALRAAGGDGRDSARLTAASKARLRRLALEWFRAEHRYQQANAKPPAAAAGQPKPFDFRPLVRKALEEWKSDPAFAAVRGPAALAALPEDEREGWQSFWADVDSLYRLVAPPPARR